MNVKLTCPKCGQHYDVELEPGVIYDDMDCQNCGGKIPVSAKQPPAQEVDYDNARLQCPSCNQVFTPLFDLKTHHDGCKCPNCGSEMRAPLEQYIHQPKSGTERKQDRQTLTKPTYNNARANFFYGLSVLFFILGNIMALVDEGKYIGFAGYCGGATIIFLLNAIYFKISAK